MIKSIRAQESGSMITAVMATLAIALILVIFAMFSMFFSIKEKVGSKAIEYSYDNQAQKSLLNLMQMKEGSLTIPDLIRYSNFNSSAMEMVKSSVENVITRIFINSAFSTTTGVVIGEPYRGFSIQIPNFDKPIIAYLTLNPSGYFDIKK